MDTSTQVTRSVERVRLELVSRKLMIMIMALTAVLTGITIILTGAPNFIEEWFSPWSRYFVGGAAFLAGLVTSIGGMVGDRTRPGWWTQVFGLALMSLWNLGMCAAYLGIVVVQGTTIVGPGEPLAAGVTGRGYVPVLYLGLAAVVLMPLVTMLRLRRPGVLGPLDD